ncbi:MAG: hypothetical protein JWQ49_5918 [Edaphobacter sp.]|nr:hypothetical protein [Edaphobacter sp.]
MITIGCYLVKGIGYWIGRGIGTLIGECRSGILIRVKDAKHLTSIVHRVRSYGRTSSVEPSRDLLQIRTACILRPMLRDP